MHMNKHSISVMWRNFNKTTVLGILENKILRLIKRKSKKAAYIDILYIKSQKKDNETNLYLKIYASL